MSDLVAGMRPAFRAVTDEQWLVRRVGCMAMNNDADVGRFLEFLAAQTEPLADSFEGRRRFAAAWVPRPLAKSILDLQSSRA